MSVRKSILIAGLGNNIPTSISSKVDNFDPSKIVEMVKADIASAKEAGFDLESHFADPKAPAETIQEFQAKLRSKKWDGVMVGFGLRGTIELTELFENIMNVSSETLPGVRFGFSTAPHAVLATAKRMFPDVKA